MNKYDFLLSPADSIQLFMSIYKNLAPAVIFRLILFVHEIYWMGLQIIHFVFARSFFFICCFRSRRSKGRKREQKSECKCLAMIPMNSGKCHNIIVECAIRCDTFVSMGCDCWFGLVWMNWRFPKAFEQVPALPKHTIHFPHIAPFRFHTCRSVVVYH